jgi:hypothetical protein
VDVVNRRWLDRKEAGATATAFAGLLGIHFLRR